MCFFCRLFFFFQAEDGIRYLVRSRGLGDVYKRQLIVTLALLGLAMALHARLIVLDSAAEGARLGAYTLSLIHI